MKSGLRTAQLATLLFGITGIAFAYVMATWEVKNHYGTSLTRFSA